MVSVAQLHWVAGLLEGEGYFGHRRNGDLIIQIAMTDKDVIDRLNSTLGLGSFPKQRLLPSGKTAYGWNLTNQSQAAGLMMTLLPLMGERRSAKIIECLDRWKGKRLWKLGPFCSHGHPLIGDNLYIVHEGKYEKRRCKECIKLRTRKWRDKQRPNGKAKRVWKQGATCSQGHPLNGDNLVLVREGNYEKRRCRECNRLRQAKHRDKRWREEWALFRQKGQKFNYGNRPWLCIDCADGVEMYCVRDAVWFAAGMPEREVTGYNEGYGDFLCLKCLEVRLGRDLVRSDFADVPIHPNGNPEVANE